MSEGHRWIPARGVLSHHGDSLIGRRFTIDPPAEIGEVISAWSTFKDKEAAIPSWVWRAALVLVALAVGLYFTFTIDGGWLVLFVCMVAALPMALVIGTERGQSFVGSKGVAEFSCSLLKPKPKASIFVFSTGSELSTRIVRKFYNGIHTATYYYFTWTRANTKPYTITGVHHRQEPGPEDRYHLARAAEEAWTAYLYPVAAKVLNGGGEVAFTVARRGTLAVTPSGLELRFGKKQTSYAFGEVMGYRIENGVFTLVAKDSTAGFFGLGAKGFHKFEYADIGNARLFLSVIEQLGVGSL